MHSQITRIRNKDGSETLETQRWPHSGLFRA